MARQSSSLLVVAIFALACLALGPVFVAPPSSSRQVLRGSPAVEELFETEAAALAAQPLANKHAKPAAALASAAISGAIALASEPAFADYDDRQKQASGVMIFVIFAAVAITAGFVIFLTNMYK
uniref:Uncharacterized protein n=1 Tax=Alexandrium andersonii TaxID=327968 RepID=A0A7S2AJN5_9DINO|mmetsp:Transcript_13684/g.31027  ORF Transcript_13684/g.31027 Transcript_13684/m.31027 type:complete len:124 (+) Transcript_13684:92-463(+)